MRIGVVGSMQHTEKMIALVGKLKSLGHDVYLTELAEPYIGKSDDVKEMIKIDLKNNKDAIRKFWKQMQGGNAILVANFNKGNIKNYIGGNTLMEIGFAHVLNQKVFLLNQIPDISYYKTEIEAMKPIVINGDLSKIIL